MKRQSIRKTVILVAFLLFPITLFYFSPVLIIEGAVLGIVSGSFVIFSLLFFLSLLLGRVHCGWACPGSGLQECCSIAVDRKAKGAKWDMIKYFIWVPWIAAIIGSFMAAGGFKKIDFFFQTRYGISVSSSYAYAIYYFVLILITVPVFIAGRRAFCHYICWMAPFMVLGRKISGVLKLPALRLSADRGKCVDCKKCNEKCQMSLDVNDMVRKGVMENSECILCGECVDTCPRGAIKYFFGRP